LTNVEAEAEEDCIVGPVIENEISFSFSASFEGRDKLTCIFTLMANLDPGGSTIHGGSEDVD